MEPSKTINIKRILTYILVAMAALALYAGLVHLVLVVAQVSKPAATTVYGLTQRRQWALVVLAVAFVSVIIGVLALRKSVSRFSILNGKRGAIVAIVAGLFALIIGGLSLATANGGPGTGNGVLGSAQALILGLTGAILGIIALSRYQKIFKSGSNRRE
jgi:Family of unknown function (DUF6223)